MSEYIDLGLPSGKLWKAYPEEGYFTFDGAVEKFGSQLPSKEDFCELLRNTTKKWDVERKGVEFTGKNGNSLFLPARGYLAGSLIYSIDNFGYYWSSTPLNSIHAYCLAFNENDKFPDYDDNRNSCDSVVLVMEK